MSYDPARDALPYEPAVTLTTPGDMPRAYDPARLDNRGVLTGVQCVCEQWWPDFQLTENALQVRTECCGSLYGIHSNGRGLFILSLIENATASREAERRHSGQQRQPGQQGQP